MKSTTIPNHKLLLAAALLGLGAFQGRAVTLSLHEQGGLTGQVVGGGGTVSISPFAPDHWQVTLQDPRIGNSNGTPASLAYIEPEMVGGLTAYNNIQVLSVVPGTAVFDVLSDEFSPYATILADSTLFPIQPTDNETIFLKFTDVADVIPEPGSASLLLIGGAVMWLQRLKARRETIAQHS